MDANDQKIIDQHVPAAVKAAVANGQLHKIAAARIGTEVLSLEKIAQHIGMKLAQKRQRWQPVAEGLLALRQLGK